MRLNPLFATLLLSSSRFVSGQGLIDTLNSGGFELFAADLQRFPALLTRLDRNDVTVWAPTNEAVVAHNAATGNATLRKREVNQVNLGYQLSHTGPPPPNLRRKRQAALLPDSNFVTLTTFLEDSAFVNLGPQQPGRCVRNEAAPVAGSLESLIEVRTGLGDIANVVNGSFKYDKGIIYGVDRY